MFLELILKGSDDSGYLASPGVEAILIKSVIMTFNVFFLIQDKSILHQLSPPRGCSENGIISTLD